MSTVIKAGERSTVAQRLTTIDLADHLAEAERMLADARCQARGIMVEARRNAAAALEAAREQGRETGLAEGYRAGVEAGKHAGLAEARERFERELGSLAAALGRAAAELESAKHRLLVAARHDVLELAVELARRVVKRVGETDREAAAANLEAALALVGEKTNVTVRVNPRDGESLRAFAPELAARFADCKHLSIVDDPDISPGGCTVHTPVAAVDARLESQLEEIAKVIGVRSLSQEV